MIVVQFANQGVSTSRYICRTSPLARQAFRFVAILGFEDVASFTMQQRDLFIVVIAQIAEVDIAQVSILSVESGSVRVVFVVFADSNPSSKLVEAATNPDSSLSRSFQANCCCYCHGAQHIFKQLVFFFCFDQEPIPLYYFFQRDS